MAEEVIRHETGPSVVMNCATYSGPKRSYLVAGQESHCQLYDVRRVLVENETIETIGEAGEREIRQRHKSSEDDSKNNNKRLKFDINPGDSVQTDFLKDEPLQRVVRINSKGNFMATGGTDSTIRLWRFPSLTKVHTLSVHKQEIDDLDFSPCENYMISIAKDGLAIIWDYVGGKELQRLAWKHPEGSRYLYKRCR